MEFQSQATSIHVLHKLLSVGQLVLLQVKLWLYSCSRKAVKSLLAFRRLCYLLFFVVET